MSLVGTLCALGLSQGAHASAPAAPTTPTTKIRARLDARSGRISGRVEVSFENTTAAPLTRAYVWLLPNRMARPPQALNDVNHYWIYPRSFNPGSMDITAASAGPPGRELRLAASAGRAEVHAAAGRGVLWSIALPRAVPPGQAVRLVLDYRAHVPERYGLFGCIDRQCTLAGGFYPMLAALDAAGWDLAAPPMRTDMTVTVDLAEPASVVLFDRVLGARGPGATRSSPVRRATARASSVAYVPLLVAPVLHESRLRAGTSAQPVILRYLSPEPPPPADDARRAILPYTKEDYAGFALDSAAEAVDLLDAIDAPARAQTLTMVEAPLRFELASPHPGVVAVSDRFYRIWPAARFRKFHQRQLVRALFAFMMGRVLAERGAEADRDLPMAADLVASYLTELFVLRQYQTREFMGDILAPVSFIPVVDQLLYAPQTMFAGAYFGSVLDSEPLRDHPARFMHERPRGKLFYEKLRDLLAPRALRQAMRAILVEGRDVRGAAEAAYGASLGWFFRQWSLPYPRVDYRLAGSRSTRLAAGGYEHEVTVERRIAAGDTPVVEPVTVEVVLEDGERERLVWDGRGRRGVLRFRSPAAIDHVIVDPDRRLVERALAQDSGHPRFNNRDAHELRFVYNSFGVLLNVTDLSALLAADFTLGRVHDVKNRARFTIYTSASTQVGLSTRYIRSFGPAITPDRRLSSLSLRLSAQRLRSGFFGDDDSRAASRLSVGVGLGASDRLFVFEPRFSRDVSAGVSLAVTRRDAVPGGPDAEYSLSGTAGADLARVYTLAGTHTLGLELDAAVAFGDIERRSQLLTAGGAGGLRGYGPSALFGRARLLARAEYRHVFAHDLSWNLGHYNVVRGVGGALFADVGALSPCDSYDVTAGGSAYASVGYGLRFFYDSFGTLPQLMRVDVAVPLVARSRECLGTMPGASPPVMVYVGFLPPF